MSGDEAEMYLDQCDREEAEDQLTEAIMSDTKDKAEWTGLLQLEGNWTEGDEKLGGWISTMHPSPLFQLIPITGTDAEIIARAHRLIHRFNTHSQLVEAIELSVAAHEAALTTLKAVGITHGGRVSLIEGARDKARTALSKAKGEGQ